MPISFKIQVNAKPEDAYAYVSDVARHGEWGNPKSDLRCEAVSGGDVTPGAKFRSTAKFINKQVSSDLEVTACEPPKRFAFTTVQHAGKKDSVFTHEFTFTPKDGGTLVTRSVDSPGAPAMQKVLGMLAFPAIRADAMAGLRRLKANLEQR
jgi:uncharacterized protein YndB with AHSA1/START domain